MRERISFHLVTCLPELNVPCFSTHNRPEPEPEPVLVVEVAPQDKGATGEPRELAAEKLQAAAPAPSKIVVAKLCVPVTRQGCVGVG